jgi:hypothetical protein
MDREGKSGQGAQYKPVRLGDILPGDLVAPPSVHLGPRNGNGSPTPSGPGTKAAAKAQQARERRADYEFFSELNLNRFPFASLWDRDTGKPGSIAIRREIAAGSTKSLFEWVVTAEQTPVGSKDYEARGLPGPFERKVFRAIERVVMARTLRKGLPLTNPQAIEMTEIFEALRITRQGCNYSRVTQALARLKTTTITCSGLVDAKVPTPAKVSMFSPISEIFWAGTKHPGTGLLLTKTHICLPQVYLDSVNAFDIRPIDWDLWLALGSRPLAQRLYEILELKFFGLKDSPYASFGYDELCQMLPTRPQERSVAEHTLGRAHDLLKDVTVKRADGQERMGLLEKVEWDWDGAHAQVRYYPDREYMARLRKRKTPELDTRALELAKEFNDMRSLAFYQLVMSKVDWQYVSAARTEVRQNRKITVPGKYFATTLRRILQGVGQPVPFGDPE